MIDQQLEKAILNSPKDKTFIDKLLGKTEVEELKRIVKKPNLNREDMLEMLYLVVGIEQKLMNYSEWDRYFLSKYFVWIRTFVELLEHYYDYKEYLTKEGLLTTEISRLYEHTMNYLQHSTKFLLDLYFHLSRSTLSLGGAMVTESLRNKFEIDYRQQLPPEKEKRSWWRW